MKLCSKCAKVFCETSFAKGRGQCKKCRAVSQKAYYQSDKGKAVQKAYRQSDKGKAVHKAYYQSDKGKAVKKAYCQSDKGKAVKKVYQQTDSYYNDLIRAGTMLKKSDIPMEIVAIKRLQIEIQRELQCH